MNNKKLIINLIASITSVVITLGISFFLTPFIVENVGTEAYGFVGLANNFVNYAQLFTLALNSLAARFITVAIHKNDIETANKYFSSVLFGNIFSSVLLLIPAATIVIFLEKLVDISPELIVDVKVLWALIFLNFLISVVTSIFNISTFASNRLELSSIRTVEASLIRVILLVTMFSVLDSRIWYVGATSIICTIFIFVWDYKYKKKLLPEINYKRKYVELSKVKTLIMSGSWSVVTKLGQILTTGLDLLLTNLFINAATMGVLAIAQTVPTALSTLLTTVSNIFSPQLTISYAKNDKEGLVNELKKSMKISGFFTNIPLIAFWVLGQLFYSLWVPTENATLLFHLTILIAVSNILSGVINSMFGIFTIVNKIKVNSIVILGMGILNVVMVFQILKFTDLGIYAIVGVSSFNAIVKNLTFTPMYTAHCLGISKKSFYPIIFRYLLASAVMGVLCTLVVNILNPYSWFTLILTGVVCAVVGVIVNVLILFNISDTKFFAKNIVAKIKKGGK